MYLYNENVINKPRCMVREEVGALKITYRKIAYMQLLVKCYDNKKAKLPL